MDTIATLIEATVYDPINNVSKVIRLTNRNDPRATTANGESWLPILLSAPEVTSSVFDGAFSGVGVNDLSTFRVTLVDGLGDDLALLAWDGAEIKIYAGDMTVLTTFPIISSATGKGADRKGRLELEVRLASRDANLETNLLYLSYAGTGNLEGDAGVKGVLKPWVFGDAKFCRAVLIDEVRQIYQVSGYGPVQDTYKVFEGGQELGAKTQDYTDFNTFRDASVPLGRWATMNSQGLFKLGSQPLYEITCHTKGDTNVGATALTKIGDIVTRILSLTTQVPVQVSSINAFNAAVPQPVNDYFDEQISVKDALARLLLSVGGYYTFNNNGNLILGRVRFGSSSFDLSGANDQLPTVMGVNQLVTSSPAWLLRLGAEECHYVHSPSDIVASIADLAQGIADAQETADGKNKVFPPSSTAPVGAISGDQWPDTSTSPATMRRFNGASWVATSNLITSAVQVPYVSGQTVESLKPGETGANVTENRTAQAITNQGAFATQNSVGYGSSFLTGFGALAPLANVYFGSSLLLESSGGAQATLNNFKTSSGTAAAIAGQGAFATVSSAAYGSSLLTGFGALSSLANVYFGSSYLLEASGGAQATLANFKTSSGTAAAIASQGALATLSSLANGSSYLTGFGPFSGLANLFFGNTNFLESSGGPTATLANFKTSSGTAAAIASQGAFATLSSAAYGSSLLTGFGALSPLSALNFGSNFLLETAGGVQATLANFKTSSGIASGIASQGALATRADVFFGNAMIKESSGGSTATLSNFKTGLGVAASISGQGAWATYARTISTITTPRSNIFPYPRPTSDGRLPSAYGFGVHDPNSLGFSQMWVSDNSNLGGKVYVTSRTSGPAGFIYPYADCELGYGPGPICASFSGYSTGSNNFYGEFYDSSGQIIPNAEFAISYNAQTYRHEGVTTRPTNATRIRIVFGVSFPATSTYQDVVAYDIKIEFSPEPTPMNVNDRAKLTNVEWANGMMLNLLRPGEFGANVTESRTASAISGQGPFATGTGYNLLTGLPGFLGNLVQGGERATADRVGYYNGAAFVGSVLDFKPQEANANVTESRTAAAFTGQGPWATYSSPINSVTTPKANLFTWPRPSADGRTPAQLGWGNTGGGTGWGELENSTYAEVGGRHYVQRRNGQYAATTLYPFRDIGGFSASAGRGFSASCRGYTSGGNGNGFAPYIEFINAAGNQILGSAECTYRSQTDRFETNQVNIPSGTETIRFVGRGSLPASNGYQDLVFWDIKFEFGAVSPIADTSNIPQTNVQWGTGATLNDLRPGEFGSNVTENRSAAAIANQGAFATQSQLGYSNINTFIQYGAIRLAYNITRSDGTTTVSESMVITQMGVASSIQGQGAGATANNLAQLDPTAQNDINSLKGGKSTYAYNELKKVRLAAGASINVSGSYGVNSGGTTSGSIRALLQAGPAGGSRSTFASGDIVTVTPTEPGQSTVSGIFTNSTGVEQLFEIGLSVTRSPSTAGGTVNQSQSFFQ